MDPISQRMMGIRADITPQISRIARTRLSKEPRPLRLSYAGEVLRVKGTQLQPSRQLTQVGAELIGSAAPEADAEVILMALNAITRIGLKHLSVDLTVPRLVPYLLDLFEIEGRQRSGLRDCLDRKDKVAVAKLSGKAAAAMEFCSMHRTSFSGASITGRRCTSWRGGSRSREGCKNSRSSGDKFTWNSINIGSS